MGVLMGLIEGLMGNLVWNRLMDWWAAWENAAVVAAGCLCVCESEDQGFKWTWDSASLRNETLKHKKKGRF
jgi:hypothetical protein